MQNYVASIQTALLFTSKLKMFMKILQVMLKKLIDYCLQERRKKVVGLMKDELGGKIMTEFIAFIPKTCSYLMDDGTSDKKAKGTKKCEIKQRRKFNDYRNCLIKSQQRFKSEAHNLYTGELTRLHYVAMVIKDCKLLRELQHIHMDRITEKTCKKILLRYKK